MSEKRILIASFLKPVNDTRMYEKLGLSLSKIYHAKVHICGYQAPTPTSTPANICFHPLFNFKRLSIGRISAQLKFLRLLLKLKPNLLIVCTHELLPVSYLYSRVHAVKIVYDIQENYALNLRTQQNYRPWLKNIFAFGIERVEKLIATSISHFILAEKSYASELNFIGTRFTILENKYKKPTEYIPPPTTVHLGDKPFRLIYSGTIAEEYGIFEAIDFAHKLHQIDAGTRLTIIGYCAKAKTLERLKATIQAKAFIHLIGGDKLVPHAQIIETLQSCNVGLLPYQPNPSTARCIPTKLFEYMAYALPILISPNNLWQKMVHNNAAGTTIDFSNINAAEVSLYLRQNPFYTFGVPEDIFWDVEEFKLIKLVSNLLQQTQTYIK